MLYEMISEKGSERFTYITVFCCSRKVRYFDGISTITTLSNTNGDTFGEIIVENQNISTTLNQEILTAFELYV